MTEHIYNPDFYDYIDQGSRLSARTVAPLLLAELQISSLLDVGAGHGAWAAEWLRAGVTDVVAIDGGYVTADRLQIPAQNFEAHNLLTPLDLGRRFDLVQSLEVAEHLPAANADAFVDSLVRHGDIVLFSAAVPFQGGEHHVNEQPPAWWQHKFEERGYVAFDWLRPQLTKLHHVKPWYRFNSVIYANSLGESRLSDGVRQSKLQSGMTVPLGGDMSWAARRLFVRLLPKYLVKPIAMGKAWFEARLRGGAGDQSNAQR